MLNRIIKFSLNNKLFILLAVVLTVIGGTYSAKNIEVDVFPDLTMPTVVILTDAPNMAPEEVERLVTFPIETAVNGATNVRRVRSSSSQGFSFVWVEFDWGMDIYRARQIISEKMSLLSGQLPDGIIPMLAPQSSVMGEVMFVGMSADSTSMMELRTLADWVIKPAILATGGVSNVTIIGGDYKQYKVLADPVKMEMYGVTMAELESAASAMSVNMGAGVLRDYGNEYNLRGMGRSNNVNELGSTVVKADGEKSIRVADVADVVIAPALKQGYASLNGSPAIILSISKQPGVNTLSVTANIEQNLKEIANRSPPM